MVSTISSDVIDLPRQIAASAGAAFNAKTTAKPAMKDLRRIAYFPLELMLVRLALNRFKSEKWTAADERLFA
jgi:hypothetical protein